MAPATLHVYNAWLPPPVAEQTVLETEAFSQAVRCLQQDRDVSPFATLKWISVVNNLLKTRSYLIISDVEQLVTTILDLFLKSKETYVQARWVVVLYKFLKKFSKKLTLTVDWRPFYDLLICYSFKRPHSFEGVALKGSLINGVANIIRKCRRYFPAGSSAEIWKEIRPMLDDLSHNASLEGAGFISLLMPMNSEADLDFYTSEWLAECLELWDGIPYCQYWDLQWASLIARCIQKSAGMNNLHLEQFMSPLFSHFLRSFEVPVGKTSGIFPYQREVSREISLTFSSASHALPKAIAKAIVYLLKPSGSAQKHLDSMIDLLEQYYHPSNGGSWTQSLERFLHHMVNNFLKRLAKEQRERTSLPEIHSKMQFHLMNNERKTFVEAVTRLIERGKFSKNSSLARTAAMVSSSLAYIEPSLMLSSSISQFQTALDSITATHQLETAIRTVALSARALLHASIKRPLTNSEAETVVTAASNEVLGSCKDTLELALMHTLSGLDANDPPKTTATLQLFCSIFSSLEKIGNEDEASSCLLLIDWSEWIDDFLSRIFILLLHLEPSNHSIEATENNLSSMFGKSFLASGGSFYLYTLQIFFSKLTGPLFDQAMRRVAKFVHNETIRGAVAEIGLLCTAVVYASPQNGVSDLMRPIMCSVLSFLEDCPPTGFSGVLNPDAHFDIKLVLSPALESSIIYQMNIVLLGLMFAGEHVLQCQQLLKEMISRSFDAPSAKVNEAGGYLLSSILGNAIFYYPLNQFKLYEQYPGLDGVEAWISTKLEDDLGWKSGPKWHLPSSNEIAFANELLDLHLKAALADLKKICQHNNQENSGASAEEKEHLRVLLLRINSSLRGIRSCLPDFLECQGLVDPQHVQPYFIAGASGASVGSVELREEAAVTLHLCCNYLLEKWSDESGLLSLLSSCIAIVGNSGGLEFAEWSSAKDSCHAESKSLTEAPINFITDLHGKGYRRPKWLVVELAYHHNLWRASQSHYNLFRARDDDVQVPVSIMVVIQDLVKLTLHNYDTIRIMATSSLKKLFKRFPRSIKEAIPELLNSLQDRLAPEHAALGSCTMLSSRAISRHLMQNFDALSSFLLAILQSEHHESFKAQNAINELFVIFIMRFGGLRMDHIQKSGYFENYASLVKRIQSICSSIDSTHWRYGLMAHGMLLLLSACDSESNIHSNVAGHFLSNLRSELPPLRVLSAAALVLLLEISHGKSKESISESVGGNSEDVKAMQTPLSSTLLETDFGKVTLQNLSVDHHYADGQIRSGQGRSVGQFSEKKNSMVWVPRNLRSWPRTRTWDSTMKGDAFSPKSAKLFQLLVQECGMAAIEAFRSPLQKAVVEPEDRGLQCAVAEVIAGFLHADAICVTDAWNEWLCSLVKNFLNQSSVESIPEWAACIRFIVTRKGRLGKKIPAMRSLIMSCLADRVAATASSNAIVKHFTFLWTAVAESPISDDEPHEAAFQQALLNEALCFVRHPAPQVREVVGTTICIIFTNLEDYNARIPSSNGKEIPIENTVDWIIKEAISASVKCQNEVIQSDESAAAENILPTSTSISNGKTGDDVQESIRFTETVLYLVITAMKSGRSHPLMHIIVGVLQPILSLQETSHKDLSSLAKVALQFLKFQIFPNAQRERAVSAILSAAADSNWRTRSTSLSFLQSFLYRHTFLLSADSLLRLWSKIEDLLADPQFEVRELAAVTLTGMMKGADELSKNFRERQLHNAVGLLRTTRSQRRRASTDASLTPISMHAVVLGLSSCALSVPYDMPSWLPKVITTLAQFAQESPPHVKATVRKTMAEFRRTHADAWAIQRSMFTDEELEILSDTSSSASYFA